MNRKTAEGYYYLQKEYEILEWKYIELVESVQAKSQKITGMSFSKTNLTSNSVLDFAIKEESITLRMREKAKEIQDLLVEIEEFIESIDNSQTRSILRLRCILLMDWKSIAELLERTEDSVKEAYRRFWRKNKSSRTHCEAKN